MTIRFLSLVATVGAVGIVVGREAVAASPLMVWQPSDLSVTQRTTNTPTATCVSPHGCGLVPIGVEPAGPVAAVQYRLRNADSPSTVLRDWTTLGLNVGSGFRVMMADVPAATTRYLIDVRDDEATSSVAAGTEVDGTDRLMVGDLAAFEGQSIAAAVFLANVIGNDGGAPGKTPRVTLLQSTGRTSAPPYCSEFADYGNNALYTFQTVPTPGTGNPHLDANGMPFWGPIADGSPSSYDSSGAVTFCTLAAANTGVAQGIIGYAVGDSEIATWQPGQNYQKRFQAIVAAATGYQPTPEIAHLVWIQGQANGAAHPSPAAYQGALSTVLGSFYDRFAVYDTSISTISTAINGGGAPNTHPESDWIRWGGMAEAAKLTAEGRRAVYVDGLDAVLSGDDVHPNQPVGAINMAADFYRALAYGAGAPSPTITGASLAGNVVTLTVRNSGTLLALHGPDTLASLFTIYPTGVHTGEPADQLAIAAATITNAHTIALTLADTPATEVDVYYRELDDADFGTAATTISNDVTESDLSGGQQLALPSATVTTTGRPTGAEPEPTAVNLTPVGATFATTGAKFGRGALSGGVLYGADVMPQNGIFTFSTWIKRAPLAAPLAGAEFIMNEYLPIGFGASGFNLSGVPCTVGSAARECLSGAYGSNSPYYLDRTIPIDDGLWHNIVVTNTGSAMIVYVDGASVSSAPSLSSGGGAFYDSSTLVLGALTPGGTDRWGGDIDEVQVLSTPTTANFTPATTAATAGPDTLELWHLDGNGADAPSSP